VGLVERPASASPWPRSWRGRAARPCSTRRIADPWSMRDRGSASSGSVVLTGEAQETAQQAGLRPVVCVRVHGGRANASTREVGLGNRSVRGVTRAGGLRAAASTTPASCSGG